MLNKIKNGIVVFALMLISCFYGAYRYTCAMQDDLAKHNLEMRLVPFRIKKTETE